MIYIERKMILNSSTTNYSFIYNFQDVVVGESCIIAGWGAKGLLSSWSGHQSTLFYAHVPVLENSLCNSWPELRGTITDSVLCAGEK